MKPRVSLILSLVSASLCLLANHILAANRTWDGGDLDLIGQWSARTNWVGNTNIVTGDSLFFPGTATIKTMQNDLTISNFTKLTFNDNGYTLNGNPLRLTNGITANYVPTGPTRLNVGVTLGANQAFEADDSSATLELNGPVSMLGFTLTNQGVGAITYLAPFSSSATGILRKRDIGTVTVRSTNSAFLGTVDVSGGEFVVDGRMLSGAVNVNNNGLLGGTGLVATVTVNSGGTISPNQAGRGILNVTNGLTLRSGGIFEATVLGSGTGQFDQLNVFGTVNLSNATLNLTLTFAPVTTTVVTLINNDGLDAVLGTFSGLPEGAVVQVSATTRATISYVGGTGNDVVLILTPLATLAWSGAVNGLWSVGGNWVGGIAPQAGDSVVFPAGVTRLSATNDLPADLLIGQIRFQTNQTLRGASIALRGGILALQTNQATVALPIQLAATQTFSNAFKDLVIQGGLDLAGFDLSISNGSAGTTVFDSEVSGAGTLRFYPPGISMLNKSNSLTGQIRVSGSVTVNDGNALGSVLQNTVVEPGGSLNFIGSSTVLEFAEPLDLFGQLNVAAQSVTWSGPISLSGTNARFVIFTNRTLTITGPMLGTNGLVKQESGTLVITNSGEAYSGTTVALDGTLQLDTRLTNSSVVVSNGATLSGLGWVGSNVTLLSGAVFSPAGEGAGHPGAFHTFIIDYSLSMQGTSVFRIHLSAPPTNPTTNRLSNDVVQVFHTVSLGSGTVRLEPHLRYTPAVGDVHFVLNNEGIDPINGFFAGWPEGATNLVDGIPMRISYTSGPGSNDISLTRVHAVRTWTGLGANNLWSTPQNWVGSALPEPGDALVFPAAASRRTNQNDFAADTPFHSISVTGDYQISGARVGLSAGVNAAFTGAVLPGLTFALPVTLLADQTFTTTNIVSEGVQYTGDVNLNGHDLTINHLGLPLVVWSGGISGTGEVRKSGSGAMLITGSTTYSGTTRVQDGSYRVRSESLGNASGSTVTSAGTFLILDSAFGATNVTEPMLVAGELSSWTGGIEWNAPFTLLDGGRVVLYDVTSEASISFPLGLGGSGSARLRGASTLNSIRLPASNSFTGELRVSGLTLEVDGTLTNTSLILENILGDPSTGVTLIGTGSVGALTVGPDCVLSPAGREGGDGTASTFTVRQSLVMQAGSTLRVDLSGTSVRDYDQVDVLGTVNLGAGVADLSPDTGFLPPEGQVFIILDNDGTDPISGTFAGLPEGTIFFDGNVRLQISYVGGTGNDISLTVLPPLDLTWTGQGSGGVWSAPANWSPARAPQDHDRLTFPGGTPRRFMTNLALGLDLHSLVFPGTGTSNNNFQLRGNPIGLSHGLIISNPASATIDTLVSVINDQTWVVRGPLSLTERVIITGDLTITGNSTLLLTSPESSGRPYVNGVATSIQGTNKLTSGLAVSAATLNYSAIQPIGGSAFVTNGTFRLQGNLASVRGLGLVASTLDLGTTGVLTPGELLEIDGDLTFTGASRLVTRHTAGSRPAIEVTGNIQLGSATLVVSNVVSAFGQPITLIRNLGSNAVIGTFAGLPQGAELIANDGTRLLVSYTGGASGRDVTLTPVAPVTGVTRVWSGGGLSGLWSESANWSGNIAPFSGDSVEFPDAPRPVNTNNMVVNRVNLLRFTGHSGAARVLRITNSFGFLQLMGGLEYGDTGTLNIPLTNSGFLNPVGWVEAQSAQTFFVTNGGTVTVDLLTGLPGSAVTKTGGGTLVLSNFGNPLGSSAGALLRQQEGRLRVGQSAEPIEQLAGILELQEAADVVTLTGGQLETAPIIAGGGVHLATLDAATAASSAVIRPGGENGVGTITSTNGITLNSNVTLRLDVSAAGNFGLITIATNDLIAFGDTGEFRPNGAKLELNFLPTFKPSASNYLFLELSRNAATNLGTFAGLPQLGLLTNELGVFRIYYRAFMPPPLLNPFAVTNNSSVILERIAARPEMLEVLDGPGAFKTVRGIGTPGFLYLLEGSEDLETWTGLTGVTPNGNGIFEFIDASGLPHRFFRARIP